MVLAVPSLPPISALTLKDGLPWAFALLVLALIVGYAYATVECALTSALAGEGPGFYWPGWRAGFSIKSALRWLFCFFAGPIVLAGLAAYYWLYGGDLTGLDWAIVAELGVLALAYWLLAIVSANEGNRLRDASPPRVMQLVHRLSYRAVVPVFVAPALLLAHALFGVFALIVLHRHVFGGWVLLAVSGCSALFWSAFVFRLLGVWCYRVPPAGAGP